MIWAAADGRAFPNRETRQGILWTDWSTWEDGAPPCAFILGAPDAANGGRVQGLWWKDWWGGIYVDEKGVECSQFRGNEHFTPFIKIDDNPTWSWDGNREAPTLSPSLLISDRYYKDPKRREVWHGYLTGGVFKSV